MVVLFLLLILGTRLRKKKSCTNYKDQLRVFHPVHIGSIPCGMAQSCAGWLHPVRGGSIPYGVAPSRTVWLHPSAGWLPPVRVGLHPVRGGSKPVEGGSIPEGVAPSQCGGSPTACWGTPSVWGENPFLCKGTTFQCTVPPVCPYICLEVLIIFLNFSKENIFSQGRVRFLLCASLANAF